MKKENLIWYERKRLWCGLPWTFTKYGMDEGRLFVETGFLNTREEERLRNRVSAREFLSHGDEDEMDAQMHDVVEEEHE